jgi:hypothetical protein
MKTRFAFVDVLEVVTIVLAVIVIGLVAARVFPVVADRVAAHASLVDPIREGVRP